MARTSKYTPSQIASQELRALELHLDGHTQREIAKALDISKTTVIRRLDAGILRHGVHADYEKLRAEQLAQCRHMARKLRRLIAEWQPTHQKVVGRGDNQQVIDVSNVPEFQILSGELRQWLETEIKLTGTAKAPVKGSDDLDGLGTQALLEIIAAGIAEDTEDEKLAAEFASIVSRIEI